MRKAIPQTGDGFQKTENSRCLGEDYVPPGDGHPIITSCYRCEAERVVEAVDSFKNTFLSSENAVMNNTCHKDKAFFTQKIK